MPRSARQRSTPRRAIGRDRIFWPAKCPAVATIQVYLANPSTGANIGDWTTAQLGQAIGVQVTASYTPMLSKFSLLPSTVPIVETAIMRSEAN